MVFIQLIAENLEHGHERRYHIGVIGLAIVEAFHTRHITSKLCLLYGALQEKMVLTTSGKVRYCAKVQTPSCISGGSFPGSMGTTFKVVNGQVALDQRFKLDRNLPINEQEQHLFILVVSSIMSLTASNISTLSHSS